LTVKKREEWFKDFLLKNNIPSQQTIMNFHRFTGDGDAANDLLMSRDGLYNTVSITCIELNGTKTKMLYLDRRENKASLKEIFCLPETGK
jgi:hypothetical protein